MKNICPLFLDVIYPEAAIIPPSTTIVCPHTHDEALEHKYIAVPAISSGEPIRFIGIFL